MNMQSQIRLVAEAGSLHPLKSHLRMAEVGEARVPGLGLLALRSPAAVPAISDEREIDLRNVVVLGCN
jgi:hypothetical protein